MNNEIVLLLDIYGELLPKSQFTALNLRYNSDLSLSEIAEEMGGISRQSVNDFLKKGKIRLAEFENILGNAARHREISFELDVMSAELSKVKDCEQFERINSLVNKIRKALE